MTKKKPAKKQQVERPALPVMVPVPEYVTTCSMPYGVLVTVLPSDQYGAEEERLKRVLMSEEYANPMEFLTCYFHAAFETAKMESQVKWESHEELDRVAHVAAEWALALIMAQ